MDKKKRETIFSNHTSETGHNKLQLSSFPSVANSLKRSTFSIKDSEYGEGWKNEIESTVKDGENDVKEEQIIENLIKSYNVKTDPQELINLIIRMNIHLGKLSIIKKKWITTEKERIVANARTSGPVLVDKFGDNKSGSMGFWWYDIAFFLSLGGTVWDAIKVSKEMNDDIPYFYGSNPGHVNDMKKLLETLDFFVDQVNQSKLDEDSATLLFKHLMKNDAKKLVNSCASLFHIFSCLFPIYMNEACRALYFANFFQLKQFSNETGASWFARLFKYARFCNNMTNDTCMRIFAENALGGFINLNGGIINNLKKDDFFCAENFSLVSKCSLPFGKESGTSIHSGRGGSNSRKKGGSNNNYSKEKMDKVEVETVNNNNIDGNDNGKTEEKTPLSLENTKCYRCFEFGHLRKECKAKKGEKACRKCNFIKCVCKKGPVVNYIQKSNVSDLANMEIESAVNVKGDQVKVSFGGPAFSDELKGILDNGSAVHIINIDDANKRRIKIDKNNSIKIFGANKNQLKIVGDAEVSLYVGENIKKIKMFVAEDTPTIFSEQLFKKMGKYILTNQDGKDDIILMNTQFYLGDDGYYRTYVKSSDELLGGYFGEKLDDKEDPEIVELTKQQTTMEEQVNIVEVKVEEYKIEDFKDRISVELTNTQEKRLLNCLNKLARNANKHPVIFDRGKTVSIKVKEKDYFVEKKIPIPRNMRGEFNSQMTKMMEAKLIRRITKEEAKCISNSFFIRKKDGTWRWVVNLVHLNTLVEKDISHLMSVNDFMDEMDPNAKVFCQMDLKSGFYHLGLDKQSQAFMAFHGIGDDEFYTWNVLTMGYTNSPAEFSNWLRELIKVIEGCLLYIDDLHLQGENVDELLDRLEKLVEIFVKYRIAVNLDKFEFGKQVHCLGKIRTENGLVHDPEKFVPLKNLPLVKTKKKLFSVVSSIKYFSDCIPNLNVSLKKFFKMSGKKFKYVWTPKIQEELQSIANKISNEIELAVPDFNLDFILTVDACIEGTGGVLFQEKDGSRRIIGMFSKCFNDTQVNWSMIEKEAYAAVSGIAKFRRYLEGKKFLLETDHKPIEYITQSMYKGNEKESIPRKLFNWFSQLRHFTFNCKHIKGKSNIGADFLSRLNKEVMLVKGVTNVDNSVSSSDKGLNVEPVLVNNLTIDEKEEDAKVDVVMRAQTDPAFTVDVFNEYVKAKLSKVDVPKECKDPIHAKIRKCADKYLKNNELFLWFDRVFKWGDIDVFSKERKKLLYVPVNKREEVLFMGHYHQTSGHLGEKGTYNLIKNNFWWDGLSSDVEEYVKRCGRCNAFKNKKVIKGELHPLDVVPPFYRMHIDLIGKLETSEDGNNCIVHAIDASTKFSIALALPRMDAHSVVEALVRHVFCVYGCPVLIISDEAQIFLSELNRLINEKLGINHDTTSPYHPATNGQVERKNGFLMDILRMLVKDDKSNWDRVLCFAVFALNLSIPRGFINSPFELMFGRPCVTPLTRVFNTPFNVISFDDWWNGFMKARKIAAAMDGLVRWENKDKVDSKATKNELKVGELVSVKTVNPSKFEERQIGPFKVVAYNKGGAELLNVETNQKLKRNINQIVRYFGDDSEISKKDLIPLMIIEEREDMDVTFFLMRWKGFGSDSDSWRPASYVKKFPELLVDWNKKKSCKEEEMVQVGENADKLLLENDKLVEDLSKRKDIKHCHGIVDVVEIIAHEETRIGFKFYVRCSEKKYNGKIVLVNLNQISSEYLVRKYLLERGLVDKRDERKNKNLRGVLWNDTF